MNSSEEDRMLRTYHILSALAENKLIGEQERIYTICADADRDMIKMLESKEQQNKSISSISHPINDDVQVPDDISEDSVETIEMTQEEYEEFVGRCGTTELHIPTRKPLHE